MTGCFLLEDLIRILNIAFMGWLIVAAQKRLIWTCDVHFAKSLKPVKQNLAQHQMEGFNTKKGETYILPLFYKKQIFDDPYLKLFKALSILEMRTLTSSRAISGEVILSRSKAKVLSNSSVTFPAEASISGKRGVDKEL